MSRHPAMRDVARRLRHRYFPERQLYFRANGVVRFLSFSPRMQMTGAAAASAFMLWVAFASFNVLAHDQIMAAKDRRIAEISRSYNELDAAMRRLQQEVALTAERLKERQNYLRRFMSEDSATENSDQAAENEGRSRRLSWSRSWDNFSLRSLKNELDALDGQQRDIASHLLGLTNETIASLDVALKGAGLSKDTLLAAVEVTPSLGTGGPYIAAGQGPDDGATVLSEPSSPADPFAELLLRRSELELLNHILTNAPFDQPVENYYISSHYGRRSDPMTHRGAVHYGIDMAGWWNSPIHATAGGKVTRAGRNGAYGNYVEIDHGNGFRTRYGHLSKVKVMAGQRLERGDIVGLMGSTGRSTGTHLHYEIWFAKRPLNPLNFIKAADDVRKIQYANSRPG